MNQGHGAPTRCLVGAPFVLISRCFRGKIWYMKKYAMRVVRGAFLNPARLDEFGVKVLEKWEGDNWIELDEVVVSLDELKELQKDMVKRYEDQPTPWYADGSLVGEEDQKIIAFGADDGEGGKIFEFNKDDKETM